MKTIACSALIVLCLAVTASADDMTAEEAMRKQMNCPGCKPYLEHPEIFPLLRHDVIQTSSGFVSAFQVADEAMLPTLMECAKKCRTVRDELMTSYAETTKDQLCPYCAGMLALSERGDVKIEDFDLSMGHMILASSQTDEGVAALHGYVAMTQEIDALIEEAGSGSGSSDQ